MHYAVYEIESKNLVSIDQTEPIGLDPVYSYVQVESYLGTWDPQTLSFIPIPPKQRAIDRKEFIERLTPEEWVNLCIAKINDPVVTAIFERLYMMDEVYPDSDFTQVMATHIVAQGYLTQERMNEVLS